MVVSIVTRGCRGLSALLDRPQIVGDNLAKKGRVAGVAPVFQPRAIFVRPMQAVPSNHLFIPHAKRPAASSFLVRADGLSL